MAGRLRSWALQIVVALLVLATALTVSRLAIREQLQRRARRLAAAHEARPTPETHRELVRLLDTHRLSKVAGYEVLHALFRPRILTRSEYAFGRPVNVEILSQLNINERFRALLVDQHPCVLVGGERIHLDITSDLQAYLVDRRGDVSAGVTCPGRHSAELHLQIEARKSKPTLRRIWGVAPLARWLPIPVPKVLCVVTTWTEGTARNSPADYQTTISVPITINVVPPDEHSPVTISTDATLDAAMRAALSVTCRRHLASSWAGRPAEVTLHAVALPAAFAFDVLYRTADGREVALNQSRPLVLPHGTTERRAITGGSYHFVLTDTRQGTLILRPNTGAAYRHLPQIDAIWGGTLAYPIAAAVESHKPAGASPPSPLHDTE